MRKEERDLTQAIRRGGAICLLCCLMLTACAAGELSVRMEPAEWTWEANQTASFTGVIQTDGEDLTGATLHLEMETRMEDSGEVLFTNLNGKKLKIRKRSDTVEMDLTGGNAENTFEGEWFLPAEVEEGLAHATVRLTISDAEGNPLKSAEMSVGSESAEEASVGTTPLGRARQLIRVLSIACAAVWLLAIARHGFLNWRKPRPSKG